MNQNGIGRLHLDEASVTQLFAAASAAAAIEALDGAFDQARAALGDGIGVVILSGFERLDGERQRVAFQRACSAFGELMAQDSSGTVVRQVRDRGMALGEGPSGRYADTRGGENLHTDGAEAPLPPPDNFALLCIRPAVAGGDLVVVPVEEIVERIPTELTAVLREPFHFDRRGDEDPGEAPTTLKPVIFDGEDGRLCITYLRRYIDLGHERAEVPSLTPEQTTALDALDGLLADPEVRRTDRLKTGELALFDNRRMLHGRTEFVDHAQPEQRRLLLRTWIRQTS